MKLNLYEANLFVLMMIYSCKNTKTVCLFVFKFKFDDMKCI